MVRLLATLASGLSFSAACSFGGQRMRDDDMSEASKASKPVALPKPIETLNNAFVSQGLLAPSDLAPGRALHESLADFAKQQGEELCYWSYQSLPPPKGGPTLLHPSRKYWDLHSGEHDQDLEWVQAYQQVAVSRLHSMIHSDGPVAGAMAASGSQQAQRRCANGRASGQQCEPTITNSNMSWPMAIAIFKVGHPELEAAISQWRGNGSYHLPNIEWDIGAGTKPFGTHPWNDGGSVPLAGDVNPSGMPQGSPWPVSEDGNVLLGHLWGEGGPMMAKVVPCSAIPLKYLYAKELYYLDHESSNSSMSTADEGYSVWRSLQGVWPPTAVCKDDVEALNSLFPSLNATGCADGMAALSQAIDNFDCDYSLTFPLVRNVCCSVCGGGPVPVPPTPAPAPVGEHYQCHVCDHIYNASKDSDGSDFEDLPESWVCPICGAPKSAYSKVDLSRTVMV